MAGQANIGRKTTAELLKSELKTISLTAGLLIKAYRSYKRPGAPNGLTQRDIANKIGVNESQISHLENGKSHGLSKNDLKKLLKLYGFDVQSASGLSILALLDFLREHTIGIKQLPSDEPK